MLYSFGMREEELRRYFLGQRSAAELSEDLRGSMSVIDQVHFSVQIVDMKESYSLTRFDLVSLCDAFIKGDISPDALEIIGFALMASDGFDWDDDVISEILSDWSAPEVNYELNAVTIRIHRQWLMGEAAPPTRERRDTNASGGQLISMRSKTPG